MQQARFEAGLEVLRIIHNEYGSTSPTKSTLSVCTAEVCAMWNFYKAVILSAFEEVWTATEKVLTVTAVLSFLAILANREFGEKLVTTWNGISPWWSVVPIGLLVSWRLLKANYTQFILVRAERDTAVTKLESTTRLPRYKPFIVPVAYGQDTEYTKGYGLFFANDDYAANTVSIPDVVIGQTMSTLHFTETLSRLAHNQEGFLEAVIKNPERPDRDGSHLCKEMVSAGTDEIEVGIVYKDTDLRRHRSNCIIKRDANVLTVRIVNQEFIG